MTRRASTRRTVLSGMTAAGLVGPALLTAGPAGAASHAPGVQIRANRTAGAAPLGVFLEAEATGFPVERPLHDLHYTWRFDDPGEWGALDPDHPHGHDRNTAYSPWTVHSFTEARPYRVTVTVTDGTHTVTAERTITPVAATEHFRGNVNFVSTSGDFAGVPRGVGRFTDLGAAVKAAGRGGLFLLRRGDTFDAGAIFRLSDECAFAAFGEGPRPVLVARTREASIQTARGPVSFEGLDFRGTYDPVTGRGRKERGLRIARTNTPVTVHDCRFTGHSIALRITGRPQLVVTDTRVFGFASFGLLYPGADLSGLRGSVIMHHPGGASGSDGKTGNKAVDRPDHGPVRLSRGLGRFVIDHCAFFSNAGWSGQFNGGAGSAHQQCVRWNSGGSGDARGPVSRCVMEGGFNVFIAATNTGNAVTRPVDLIFEKNYLLASANTFSTAVFGAGGSTIRNNVFVRPRVVPEYVPHRERAHLSWLVPNPVPENAATPVRVQNNAFVDLRADAEAPGPSGIAANGPDHFDDLAVSANILHAPNLPEPVTPHAPLEMAPALFTPKYEGKRLDDAFDPAHATPPDTPASFRPLPGSPALGAGPPGPGVLDDFEGTPRRGETAAGPYHAAAAR